MSKATQAEGVYGERYTVQMDAFIQGFMPT